MEKIHFGLFVADHEGADHFVDVRFFTVFRVGFQDFVPFGVVAD